MREKPERSPMVPPIADNWSTILAARSCKYYKIIFKVNTQVIMNLLNPVKSGGGE